MFWYHTDHLGTTGFLTDASGEVREHVEYFPFGEPWVTENVASDPGTVAPDRFLFTGKEQDSETGLYYFRARYFDAHAALWVSPDPILGDYLGGSPNGGVFNPGNLGLYSYSFNSPVWLRDPDGRCPAGWNASQCAAGNAAHRAALAQAETVADFDQAVLYSPASSAPGFALQRILAMHSRGTATPADDAYAAAAITSSLADHVAATRAVRQAANAPSRQPQLEEPGSGQPSGSSGATAPFSIPQLSAPPGSAGVQVQGRLTPEQMETLTRSHGGIEFALVYRTGAGRNGGGGTYWLYSGDASSVRIPSGPNIRAIYHTHPGGTPYASGGGPNEENPYVGDRGWLRYQADVHGSPQRSSVVVPVNGQPVRYSSENSGAR